MSPGQRPESPRPCEARRPPLDGSRVGAPPASRECRTSRLPAAALLFLRLVLVLVLISLGLALGSARALFLCGGSRLGRSRRGLLLLAAAAASRKHRREADRQDCADKKPHDALLVWFCWWAAARREASYQFANSAITARRLRR